MTASVTLAIECLREWEANTMAVDVVEDDEVMIDRLLLHFQRCNDVFFRLVNHVIEKESRKSDDSRNQVFVDVLNQ